MCSVVLNSIVEYFSGGIEDLWFNVWNQIGLFFLTFAVIPLLGLIINPNYYIILLESHFDYNLIINVDYCAKI